MPSQWPSSAAAELLHRYRYRLRPLSRSKAVKGNPVAECSRNEWLEQRKARRLNVFRGNVPAIKGAFVVIAVTFAEPRRCRKTGSGQFPDNLFRLFIGVSFNFPPMRRNGDEVSLLSIVIGHFKEPDTNRLSILGRVIDNFGLDYCCHFSIGAEPLPSRLASANDVGPLRIAHVVVRDWPVSRYIRQRN